mmetsp:Transcript_139112/g.245802  ORF Transcript_139112/g.245802 Transcript_139112/m.245802 type:complete len:240 (+) Transcript_139112:764-1483(+)
MVFKVCRNDLDTVCLEHLLPACWIIATMPQHPQRLTNRLGGLWAPQCWDAPISVNAPQKNNYLSNQAHAEHITHAVISIHCDGGERPQEAEEAECETLSGRNLRQSVAQILRCGFYGALVYHLLTTVAEDGHCAQRLGNVLLDELIVALEEQLGQPRQCGAWRNGASELSRHAHIAHRHVTPSTDHQGQTADDARSLTLHLDRVMHQEVCRCSNCFRSHSLTFVLLMSAEVADGGKSLT